MASRPTKLERRHKILEAARAVFSRRGYAATRMSDVALRARVGKGTLYEYFRSKEDLFSTLVIVTMRESLDALTRRTVAADPEQTLRETIRFAIEIGLVENLDLYRLFYDFWGIAASHRGEAQRRLREVAAPFREFVVSTVRQGQATGAFRAEVDPVQFARALSAAIDGLSLQLVILGEQINLKDYADHLQGMFLGGLNTEGALGGASILKEKT